MRKLCNGHATTLGDFTQIDPYVNIITNSKSVILNSEYELQSNCKSFNDISAIVEWLLFS